MAGAVFNLRLVDSLKSTRVLTGLKSDYLTHLLTHDSSWLRNYWVKLESYLTRVKKYDSSWENVNITPSNMFGNVGSAIYRTPPLQGGACWRPSRVQGGLSGRRQHFVDIKLKAPPQYKLLILKCNSHLNVNKRLSLTRWTTLYKAIYTIIYENGGWERKHQLKCSIQSWSDSLKWEQMGALGRGRGICCFPTNQTMRNEQAWKQYCVFVRKLSLV